jgi:Flp pilus assembly protein TadG
MRVARDDAGLAVLYATLLIPTFLILLCFVVEVGALRVTRARLVAAADIAATSAVN